MGWSNLMQGMIVMTQMNVPDNLEVFEETPAPRHRQGWRRWLASVRMRRMILQAISTVLGFLIFFWALKQTSIAFIAIIPGSYLWMLCGVEFAEHLRVLRGEGMTPELKRWCLHRLRLVGEDPDPLFLTLDDLQRAIRVDEARAGAIRQAAVMEQDTAKAVGSRRQVRL